MEPSRDEILKALEQVIDPELRRPVTELDMVRDVRIDGGDVAVTIALTVAGCPLRSSFEQQVGGALAPVDGVALETTGWNLRGNLLRRIDGGVFTLGIANVVVVYSHGWDVSDPITLPVPADIRMVALIAARRVYSAVGATDAAGTQQSETMGSYSYTSGSTAQVASTAAQLLDPEKEVLHWYRVGLIP